MSDRDIATADTVAAAAASPDRAQPYAALGLTDDEYARIRTILGRRPTSAELAIYSVMWSEHCSYKSSRSAPAPVRREGPGHGRAAGRHGRERRRGRRRPGLRRHLQDRVAQPPVLRRAVPGCGHRRRRHRARHPDHGRTAGRGDGLAAVRACRRPRHRAGAARRGGRHRRLRQLPGPAEHRRRGGLRPVLLGQPAGQRAVRRGAAAADLKLAKADGPGNLVSCSARAPGGDGIGGASVLASATFDGRARARSGRVCRSATRSPRRCSSSAAWRSSPPTWWSASRISARPGCRARPPELAAARHRRMDVDLDAAPLRDASLGPERS